MQIIAHRGASAYAPENTIASFDLACRMGAAALETDVRCTRDGQPVLLHDAQVDRTTNGAGAVADIDSADLAALDAGGWFASTFAGQRVPRLTDFLDRYLGRIGLCLELKCEAAIEPIAQALSARAWDPQSVQFASFDWPLLEAMRAKLPDAAFGALIRTADVDAGRIRRAADAGFAKVCLPVGSVTPQLVGAAHDLGLSVRTWGVGSRADLAHAAHCRVDATTLNWPDWRPPAAPPDPRRGDHTPTTIPS